MSFKKTIWFVSREYAGIAEAGGVKNVAASLAEGLYQEGCTVCVFMPLYGCTVLNGITDFIISPCSACIKSGGKEYTVYFATIRFLPKRWGFTHTPKMKNALINVMYRAEDTKIRFC